MPDNIISAISYLKKVLKWSVFCKTHRLFAKSIQEVVLYLEESK